MKSIALATSLYLALTTAGLRATDRPAVAPPLHTEGVHIVDARGQQVRLTSVNWFGFDEGEYIAGGLDHQPLAAIVERIKETGVNSVRLPWANEVVEKNPLPPAYAIKANPELKGLHAMEIMDRVVEALTRAHLMVILDNHVSRADWCCDEKDGNGLWYSDEYPETAWLKDWQSIVRRYKANKWVVGADLRNELRSGARWGGTDAKLDWHAAAERGGNAILAVNSKLLIFVESPAYSTDFRGFDTLPVRLKVAGRLVYSPHAYNMEGRKFTDAELAALYEERAMFLLKSKAPAPIWVGEFGACQKLDCGAVSDWFRQYIAYLRQHPEVGWSLWPLNGSQASGRMRKYDTPEDWGLLTPDWSTVAAPEMVELLKSVE